MLGVQALLLLAAALPRAAAVAITWMSEPTFPGETLLLHGVGFSSACALTLTPSPPTAAPVTLAALPGQASDASLKFALPLTLPPGALALALACPAANYTHPALLNAASAWWFQGDVGSAATAGGWLRVLGPTLALQAPASQEAALLRGIRAARDALSAPSAAADAAWEEGSPMAAAAAQLLALRAQLASVRAAPSHLRATLRLTPLTGGGGAPLYLPAQADSLAPHSAAFALPPSLPLGEYAVAVANGAGADTDGGGGGAGAGAGAFVPVAFFESAARPAVASIRVLAPRAWPPGVFLVDTPADPCSPLPCPTSDASLARALAQAQAAGGGTVLFPRGAYFLTAPVALPPNTVLAGTSREEVAVWFAEWSVASAPQDALFALNDTLARASAAAPAMGAAGAGSGLASWGLANFTLYLTAFHNEVIVTSNATDGFVLQGMRVRDNPFAFVWGTGPAMGSRGRVANFTTAQVGQLVDIHSVNNVITGNDLFGVNQILNSFASNGCCGRNNWPSWRRGHSYSRITDNVIYNGQSSHFMQLWRQILFERNVIRGSTTTAGGQSVGTGPMGGVAQHIYHADNTVHYTWGGDREVMTYDDAGGAYWGQLESVAGTTLTLAGDAWPASDWEMGGWAGGQVLIINGTGAHQFRRITVPGVNVTPSATNRTWVVDQPFAVPPATIADSGAGAASFVQIMPFRGRNIFYRDTNEDSGPHQYYGHAVQNIMTQVLFKRVRGVMAWGQWRGWVPPPRANESQQPTLGGLMGNGLQPNLQNHYREVVFTERHHLTNYACGESGYTEQWGWRNLVHYPDQLLNNATAKSPHPLNVGIVHRGMSAPGGMWLGNGSSDVIFENANISWAGGGECVEGAKALDTLFYEAGNVCTP